MWMRSTPGPMRLGPGVRAPDLAEHLPFADDGRIEAAGDREQVLDGRLRVAHVRVPGEVVQRHAGVFGEHLPDHRQATMECVDDRVDLDAVAGRQDHRLGDQRRLQKTVGDLFPVGVLGAQLLEHRHRCGAVRYPKEQNAHGRITTYPR